MDLKLRRRLERIDPNLKIVGRTKTITRLPRVLSPQEAKQWGLPEMIPVIPTETILAIEAKWSKRQLKTMCIEYFLDPRGDKELLTEKLLYVGAIDQEGERTGLAPEPVQVPYLIGPPKKFCCRVCGKCVPPELLKEGRFLDRMTWLRQHYKEKHPGVWGKR